MLQIPLLTNNLLEYSVRPIECVILAFSCGRWLIACYGLIGDKNAGFGCCNWSDILQTNYRTRLLVLNKK